LEVTIFTLRILILRGEERLLFDFLGLFKHAKDLPCRCSLKLSFLFLIFYFERNMKILWNFSQRGETSFWFSWDYSSMPRTCQVDEVSNCSSPGYVFYFEGNMKILWNFSQSWIFDVYEVINVGILRSGYSKWLNNLQIQVFYFICQLLLLVNIICSINDLPNYCYLLSDWSDRKLSKDQLHFYLLLM
jgi:hypothetical protein